MIYIVNKRHFKREGEDVVYIGRPSIYGNPFQVDAMHGMTREHVIKLYKGCFNRTLLTEPEFQLAIMRILHKARLHDVYLVCWCAPLDCHGRVIKEFIDAILESEGLKWN
jgi:hypothetical protein